MLNHWTGMGRLTADPTFKMTQSGTSVVTFTVAIDRNIKSKDGERGTDFINVVAWNKTAEFIGTWFKKGSMIAVEGTVQTRSYTANDGSKRYVTEIIAERVHFAGGKKETTTGNTTSADTSAFDNYEPDFNDMPF